MRRFANDASANLNKKSLRLLRPPAPKYYINVSFPKIKEPKK
jgi:hypothetical protein